MTQAQVLDALRDEKERLAKLALECEAALLISYSIGQRAGVTIVGESEDIKEAVAALLVRVMQHTKPGEPRLAVGLALAEMCVILSKANDEELAVIWGKVE